MTTTPETAADGFSNEPVEPGRIPEYQRVTLNGVSDKYLPYALISNLTFWIVLTIAALALRQVPFMPFTIPLFVPAITAFLAVWWTVYSRMDARRRGWALREHDLIYRYGVFWRRTVVVPFARIQHVEAAHGPLERAFGLMRLKCFTAGGMNADLTVKGLDGDNARRIRAYLLEQIRDDDEGDDGGPAAGEGAVMSGDDDGF